MPNFDYTSVPVSSHNPSVDQPNMLINTNSIENILEVDHYGFNNNLGGYHKQVDLVNEADPGLPVGVGSVLFSNNNQLIFKNIDTGVNSIQMTSSTRFPISSTSGRTFLPGGIFMQWGTVAATGGVGFPVTFNDDFSTVFLVLVTASGSGTTIANTVGVSNAGFTITTNITAFVSWLAIGAV
jgi:hypothetical protein